MPSLPSQSPILKNLSYIVDAQLVANETNGGSPFGGFSSLLQRDESFHIKESMHILCGYDPHPHAFYKTKLLQSLLQWHTLEIYSSVIVFELSRLIVFLQICQRTKTWSRDWV